RQQRAGVLLSSLPYEIAQRELERVRERLGWEVHVRDVVSPPRCPASGNMLWLEIASDHVTEVCSALGEQGKPAEHVADEAIMHARDYIASTAPAGVHLADQLMTPLAIACAKGAGACSFRTLPLSRHAATNSAVIELFLPGMTRTQRDGDDVTWT